MTEQTIPADKVREIIHVNTFRGVVMPHCRASIIDQLEALLPAPPRPTLANMTEEERRACKWMQADVAGHNTRYVITNPCDEDDEAELIAADGKIEWILPEYVTPRPDLPRMEWPADKKVEEAAPVKVGDVIESADDPRLDALPAGSALLDRDDDAVTKQGEAWTGDGYIPNAEEGDEFGPWTVRRIGWEADQ